MTGGESQCILVCPTVNTAGVCMLCVRLVLRDAIQHSSSFTLLSRVCLGHENCSSSPWSIKTSPLLSSAGPVVLYYEALIIVLEPAMSNFSGRKLTHAGGACCLKWGEELDPRLTVPSDNALVIM